MVEKYIETLPFTASVFVVALTIVAVLVAVFLLFMRLLDDHPVVFVIVMVVITFLVFNFLLSLGGVACCPARIQWRWPSVRRCLIVLLRLLPSSVV